MNKIFKYSTIALATILMGCTPQPMPVFPANPNISESTTEYSKIKDDINSMLMVFYGKPINILIDAIENKTKEQVELPNDISSIVRTSFNNIGTYVNTIANHNKIKDEQVYIIHGAITGYAVTEEKNSGTNGDIDIERGKIITTASGELSGESKIAELTINFNPEDIKTGSYVSKASTSNKITIYQISNSTEIGFSIFGTGVGYNKTVTRTQGTHYPITILVDLSVAVVLGKVAKFPYWLLTKGEVDNNILNKLNDDFLDDKLPQKLYKISYLLSLKDKSVQPTRVMTKSLKEAIRRYKIAHRMRGNLYLSQEFYRSLLRG